MRDVRHASAVALRSSVRSESTRPVPLVRLQRLARIHVVDVWVVRIQQRVVDWRRRTSPIVPFLIPCHSHLTNALPGGGFLVVALNCGF